MPVATVAKPIVACELLARAIELYLRGDSYYSALHLGGAAEEVLAGCARATPASSTATLKPTFDQMKDLVVALSDPVSLEEQKRVENWAYHRMTHAKNSIKHKRGQSDHTVTFDSKQEAFDTIDRAVSTYYQLLSTLALPHLSAIDDFDSKARSERSL